MIDQERKPTPFLYLTYVSNNVPTEAMMVNRTRKQKRRQRRVDQEERNHAKLKALGKEMHFNQNNINAQLLGYGSYEQYLRSDHWASFKTRYRSSSLPQSCRVCGTTEEIHLHHVTYDRMGAEKYSDVVPVCNYHHGKLHSLHIRQALPLADWKTATRLLRQRFGITDPLPAK